MNNTPNQPNTPKPKRPGQPQLQRPVRALRQPTQMPGQGQHKPLQNAERPGSMAQKPAREPAEQHTIQSSIPAVSRPAGPSPRQQQVSAHQIPHSSAGQPAVRRPVQPPAAAPAQNISPSKAEAPVQRASSARSMPQAAPSRRLPTADDSATRKLSTIPPAVQSGRMTGASPAASGKTPVGKEPKKKKKHLSEGATTLLSIVKAITYIVFVIVLAGFLSYYIIQVSNDMFAFVKSDEQREIVIPEYATIDDVSELLAENGIIKYPDIFKLYAKLNKDDGNFVAGSYEINPMMNYDELLMAFKEKVIRERKWITIPEGYTVDEIIDLFVSNGMGTREGFVDAINNYPYDFEFVRALEGNTSSDRTYRLEGYLFPDTYEFYTDAKESQIIYKLLNRFNTLFREDFYTRSAELGYTVDEVIILASMIEKETRFYNEFEFVSSVFHNRLNHADSYPFLESDATIMYAIQHDTGTRKEEMTGEDTNYNSPYNTYTHKGLPPGPIANPSYQAITCALYPEASTYYYFVASRSGETIFSSTYAEHQAAIASVRNGR